MATKLSQNPKYGQPSARKMNARLNAWRVWAQGMAMLRQIHAELASTLTAKDTAQAALEDAGKWNA